MLMAAQKKDGQILDNVFSRGHTQSWLFWITSYNCGFWLRYGGLMKLYFQSARKNVLKAAPVKIILLSFSVDHQI